LLAAAVLVLGLTSPAQAIFLPPPWRLAILFDRPVWEPAAGYERRVPLRYGMEPLTFEERVHG
jgi:hypothetical protein